MPDEQARSVVEAGVGEVEIVADADGAGVGVVAGDDGVGVGGAGLGVREVSCGRERKAGGKRGSI